VRETAPVIEWTGESEFRVGNTEFVCCLPGTEIESTPERFMIQKARWAIDEYAVLIELLRPRTILEVGLLRGGSVALVSLLAEPQKLVGVELSPERLPHLDTFIADRGLGDRVALHHGVDQADTEALARICEEDLPDGIDLVIDDASHDWEPSRTTLEALFPRLRPGATYLLEDWSWAHAPFRIRRDRTALTVLVFELTLACARHPELIERVDINTDWALIRRGPGELPADTAFRLGDLVDERGRGLVPAIDEGEPGTREARARAPRRGSIVGEFRDRLRRRKHRSPRG
jgi:predicted O-methyltransferase YrrM